MDAKVFDLARRLSESSSAENLYTPIDYTEQASGLFEPVPVIDSLA